MRVLISALLLVLESLVSTLTFCGENIPVEKIGVVDVSKLTGADGKPASGFGESDRMDKYHFNQKQYGFTRGGAAVYFGEGCQEFSLHDRRLSCDLPGTLRDVFIPPDGKRIYGSWKENGSVLIEFLDDNKASVKEISERVSGQRFRDPTGKYSAEDGDMGFAPTQIYKSLYVFNITTGKKSIYNIKGGSYSFFGFSGSGRYVFTDSKSIDLKTGKTVAVSTPTNYDATLRYERASPSDPMNGLFGTGLYDLVQKRYLWKSDVDYGEQLAFSWNGAFIVTSKGYLLSASNGLPVAKGLEGDRGARFSPDGTSFVTTNNKAFYIYQAVDSHRGVFGKYPGPTFTPNF